MTSVILEKTTLLFQTSPLNRGEKANKLKKKKANRKNSNQTTKQQQNTKPPNTTPLTDKHL